MKDQYFLDMCAAEPDPWGFERRWYEQRNYQVTMACLVRDRRVFEPECSVGVLTALLADPGGLCRRPGHRPGGPRADDRESPRCWRERPCLRRTLGHADPWPETGYDLVVISEVLYYLEADEAGQFMAQTVEHLDADGHVVVAHWQTRVPEYPLSGAVAQRIACETDGLKVVGTYRDDDLSLDVLGRTGSTTIATTTGLR